MSRRIKLNEVEKKKTSKSVEIDFNSRKRNHILKSTDEQKNSNSSLKIKLVQQFN